MILEIMHDCEICHQLITSEMELKHNKCWVCIRLFKTVEKEIADDIEEAKKYAKYD